MPNRKDNKKFKGDLLRGFSQVSQIGISIAVCIAMGVLIGRFLDDFFGSSPWLLLVFSLLGIGAAFKTILELAKRM